MKLSVIIPVYNEKDTILKVIESIKLVPINKEIIVADDGSNDGTRVVLENIERQNSNIKIIYHPKNQGKGAAIRSGLQSVTGDVVIIQDADLEYDPAEYPRLLAPIEKGITSVVYGSRFKGGGKFLMSSLIANRILTFMTSVLYFSRLTDMETCYKCIKGDVINNLNLKANRFDFEVEVTSKLLRMGYEIFEVPISYQGRSLKRGKKIGVKDGIQAVLTLVKWRIK